MAFERRIGGLGGRVVDCLGELDAFLLQVPLPLPRGLPSGAFESLGEERQKLSFGSAHGRSRRGKSIPRRSASRTVTGSRSVQIAWAYVQERTRDPMIEGHRSGWSQHPDAGLSRLRGGNNCPIQRSDEQIQKVCTADRGRPSGGHRSVFR